MEHEHHHEKTSFYPLIVIVGYIILFSAVTSLVTTVSWMPLFMGYFFLFFSLFKMLDIPGFAKAYRRYDILTQAMPIWGYMYPIVELALGVLYLAGINTLWLHGITGTLMLIGLIGVTKSVLSKQQIKCACLGTGFNLPMTTVTIIEDGVMVLMALGMIATLI